MCSGAAILNQLNITPQLPVISMVILLASMVIMLIALLLILVKMRQRSPSFTSESQKAAQSVSTLPGMGSMSDLFKGGDSTGLGSLGSGRRNTNLPGREGTLRRGNSHKRIQRVRKQSTSVKNDAPVAALVEEEDVVVHVGRASISKAEDIVQYQLSRPAI